MPPQSPETGHLIGVGILTYRRSWEYTDDATCLELLQDDLELNQVWLLLFMEGGKPAGRTGDYGQEAQAVLRVPEGYLPRPFSITDACITNADAVWFFKHFYL